MTNPPRKVKHAYPTQDDYATGVAIQANFSQVDLAESAGPDGRCDSVARETDGDSRLARDGLEPGRTVC